MMPAITSPALRYARPSNMPRFVPDPNCKLWFPGQDDAYSATIRDRSGNGNDGTLVGATWARLSNGLWVTSHDGTDDYITTTGGIVVAGAFSVEVWAKNAAINARRYIYVEEVTPFANQHFYIRVSIDNTITGYMRNNAASASVDITSVVTVGTGWYHYVWVSTASNAHELFLNGVSIGASTTEIGLISGLNAFGFGYSLSASTYDWSGNLALERRYNAALSATEIARHYQLERSLFRV